MKVIVRIRARSMLEKRKQLISMRNMSKELCGRDLQTNICNSGNSNIRNDGTQSHDSELSGNGRRCGSDTPKHSFLRCQMVVKVIVVQQVLIELDTALTPDTIGGSGGIASPVRYAPIV